MAEVLDLSLFVERSNAGTAHMTLAVEGIGCAGCIRKIENGLSKLPGVIDARLNFTQQRLAIDWRDNEIDAAGIIKALEGIGYRAHPFAPERAEADEGAQAKWLLKCLAVAGFAAMNVMLLSISVWAGNVSDMTQETRDLFHWLSALIALPAAAYAGQPFFQSALKALRARSLNMDVPISLGVTASVGLVGVRDRGARYPRLFRFGNHAAVLPAVRPLPRPGDAAQDAHVRGQSREPQVGIRPPARFTAANLRRCRSRPCIRAIGFSSVPVNAFPPTAL